MAKARKEVELAVRIGHRPGELARLWTVISAHEINILAYCAYSERDEGCVMLITDDPERTRAALEKAGYRCQTDPVIVVHAPDRIGAAAALGRHLGEAGINILYSYASSSGQHFYAVFKTDNDDLAAQVLDCLPPDELA
jgi:hypothetical protein